MWLYVYFLSLKERILCFELFLTHYSCPYMWYSGRPLGPSVTMFHEPLIENSVASWVSYICTHLEPILWCKTSSYQFYRHLICLLMQTCGWRYSKCGQAEAECLVLDWIQHTKVWLSRWAINDHAVIQSEWYKWSRVASSEATTTHNRFMALKTLFPQVLLVRHESTFFCQILFPEILLLRLLTAMMVVFILLKVDYCNLVLLGLPKRDLDRQQSVFNAAARLITGTRTRRYDHVTLLLKDLHWLRERVTHKLRLLTVYFQCKQ